MNSKDPFEFDDDALMNCIVIGGVADGLFVRGVKINAQQIELTRPTNVKPLASPNQAQPDVETESDVYNVSAFTVQDGDKMTVVGMAVVDGQTQVYGFQQLLLAYVQQKTAELMDEARRGELTKRH